MQDLGIGSSTFGPEARPPDWKSTGGIGGGLGNPSQLGGNGASGIGGTKGFGWVSVETGDTSRARGNGGLDGGMSQIPVDDAVIVQNLTSQVESSSITTRNGAIQREMQDAYRKLICANVERKLTLQDVASFSTFLVGVRVRLHEKGSNLRRRHSVLSSLLKHAPRARVQRIYSDLAAVEEQEAALSKDVDLFNKLQQDLKESPAYKAMMEYGKSSGMVNVDGTMMPDPAKHPELEAMAAMSVKDMLAEFKLEDKRNMENSNRVAAAAASAAAVAASQTIRSDGVSPSPRGGGGGNGAQSVGRGAAGREAPFSQKSKKGKKGKNRRR